MVGVGQNSQSDQLTDCLKVHKNANFFGSDFEFCTSSLLFMPKYDDFVKQKILIGPLWGR
jgi:hypothetical protein